MSDLRRFKWRSGRLASTPINDGWALDLDSRDPSIPNLPLEGASTGATLAPGVGYVQVVSLTAYVVDAVNDNRPRVTIQGRIPTVVDISVGGSTATALPGVGLVTIGGLQPAQLREIVLTPGAALAVAQGLAPAKGLERTLTPETGLVTIGGLSGNVLGAGQIGPTTGLSIIQGLAPTVSGELTLPGVVNPGVGAAIVQGRTPSALPQNAIWPATGFAQVQGLAPTLELTEPVAAATLEPGVGLVTLDGLAPTVSAGDVSSGTYPRKRRRGRSTPIPEYSADSAVAVPYAPPAQPLPGEPIPLRVGLGALAGMDLRRVVVPVKPEPAIDDNRAAIRRRRRREEDLILQMILAA